MWLQTLAAELLITLGDATVWLSIGQALLIGAVCLLFGVWASRFVGLLGAEAPAGETLAVGLASGLLVLTSWWAAITSGGRSAFTPVAVGFVVAIVLAATRRWREPRRSCGVAPDRPSMPTAGGAVATCLLPSSAAPCSSSWWPSSTVRPWSRVRAMAFSPWNSRTRPYYSILGAELAEPGPRRPSLRRASIRSTGSRPRLGTTGARRGSLQPPSRSSAPLRWTPDTSWSCRCMLLAAAVRPAHLFVGYPVSVSRAVPLRFFACLFLAPSRSSGPVISARGPWA